MTTDLILSMTGHTEDCDGPCSNGECDNCGRDVAGCHITRRRSAGLEAYVCHVCAYESCLYCESKEAR